MVNNLEFPVEIRQHTYRGSVVVPPGTRAPYHFVHASGKRYCSMRIRANAESGASWDWSGSFQVAEPGDFGMSVRDLNSDAVFLARIEVRASDASLFIVIDREHPKCPPYRIINKTGYDRVRFCQTHVYKWLTVEPCSVCTYSWDQPLGVDGELSLSVEVTGDKKGARVYDLEELGSLDTITLTQPSQRQLFVYVFAEGPTKVLVLSDLPNPDVAFDPKASEEAQARALAAIKLLESVDVLDIQESRLKLVKDRVNTLRNDMRTIKRKIREIKKARRVPSDAKAPASASRSRSTLRVTLVEAASLSGVTWRGSADVFARVVFRGRAHETETLPSNLNPWFDHKFDLDATPMRAGMEVTDPGHPLNSTIKVALFSRSGIGSPDFLGGVIIRLGELAEYIVNEKQRRKKAKSKEMDGDGAGRVRFAAAAETPSADDEPVSVQRW